MNVKPGVQRLAGINNDHQLIYWFTDLTHVNNFLAPQATCLHIYTTRKGISLSFRNSHMFSEHQSLWVISFSCFVSSVLFEAPPSPNYMPIFLMVIIPFFSIDFFTCVSFVLFFRIELNYFLQGHGLHLGLVGRKQFGFPSWCPIPLHFVPHRCSSRYFVPVERTQIEVIRACDVRWRDHATTGRSAPWTGFSD